MFQEFNLKDMLQLGLIIFVAVIGGYLYANNQARNYLWEAIYPIRAKISVKQMTCSPNSPSWLADIIKYKALAENAPSNQIAYIDSQGKLYHCENGYVGKYPLLSKPLNSNDRFRYASLTKLWTADNILDWIKEGKISLDTRLTQVMPEISQPKDERVNHITIEQLLLHRAGFDRYKVFGQDMFSRQEPICPNHLKKLNKIQLGFTPDSKLSYSNLGYCLLGKVIANLSHESYSTYMVEQYGLENTTLQFLSNNKMENEVDYNYVEKGLTGMGNLYEAFDYTTLDSSAGLIGNAKDAAIQIRLMIEKPQPNILSQSTTHPCKLTSFDECYGYGMQPYRSDINRPIVYFKEGDLLGVNNLVVASEKKEVLVLLSNGEPDYIQRQNNILKKLVYSQLIK